MACVCVQVAVQAWVAAAGSEGSEVDELWEAAGTAELWAREADGWSIIDQVTLTTLSCTQILTADTTAAARSTVQTYK